MRIKYAQCRTHCGCLTTVTLTTMKGVRGITDDWLQQPEGSAITGQKRLYSRGRRGSQGGCGEGRVIGLGIGLDGTDSFYLKRPK